ncbi:hypothetical protein HD553DRAFT_308929 [Filobasidium floriforme]|uniref:uncharacterized protein n=1 Tax=Filobasidium floriforme TaxID=5210 RepID=UPI001E8CDF42|nr:uncharacterized protein HD553DRAFT_308929 [Filobasidium floriforme]KAH8086965.1 hypothetical protein HD553DRAFT_308929 [Filobasidium floriforme]
MTLLLMLLVRARGLVSLEFRQERVGHGGLGEQANGGVDGERGRVSGSQGRGEGDEDEVSGADVCSARLVLPPTLAPKRDELMVEIQSFSI